MTPDNLPPLPEPAELSPFGGWSAAQMRAYAAQAVAQERERWRVLLMAHRDRTVMSCYASVRECEAARNALQRVLDDIDSRGTT